MNNALELSKAELAEVTRFGIHDADLEADRYARHEAHTSANEPSTDTDVPPDLINPAQRHTRARDEAITEPELEELLILALCAGNSEDWIHNNILTREQELQAATLLAKAAGAYYLVLWPYGLTGQAVVTSSLIRGRIDIPLESRRCATRLLDYAITGDDDEFVAWLKLMQRPFVTPTLFALVDIVRNLSTRMSDVYWERRGESE